MIILLFLLTWFYHLQDLFSSFPANCYYKQFSQNTSLCFSKAAYFWIVY